jgi:hypothetical protein
VLALDLIHREIPADSGQRRGLLGDPFG